MTQSATLLVAVIILLFVCVFQLCMRKEKATDGRQCASRAPRIQSYYFPATSVPGAPNAPGAPGARGDARTTVGFLAGVHGNEPAGAVTLQALINSGWFAQAAREYGVNIVVVPRANESGLQRDVRWTNNFMHPDLNRSFVSESGDTPLAGELLNIFADVDILIDFHEGWGWHRITPASIGSTVSPTQTESQLSDSIARKITDNLNANISNPEYEFTFLPNISCDIRSSLSCYMELAGREYILIETTGQKNVQPMTVRADQIRKSVTTVLTSVAG